MCEKCDELEEKIRRYERLVRQVNDVQFVCAIEELKQLALEEKAARHQEE